MGLLLLFSVEYQEYFLGGKGSPCVALTTSPLSYADCLKVLVFQAVVVFCVELGGFCVVALCCLNCHMLAVGFHIGALLYSNWRVILRRN
jgi:hypothetical protein